MELARQAGAEWMIALAPGEAVAEDAFELAAPGLDLYDAIFGAAHVRGSSEAVAKLSRLAFDTAEQLPHALLNWWMPDAHLVRTELAARTLDTRCGERRPKLEARLSVRYLEQRTLPEVGAAAARTRRRAAAA